MTKILLGVDGLQIQFWEYHNEELCKHNLNFFQMAMLSLPYVATFLGLVYLRKL